MLAGPTAHLLLCSQPASGQATDLSTARGVGTPCSRAICISSISEVSHGLAFAHTMTL